MQVTQKQTEGFEISPQQARLWQIAGEKTDLYRVFAKIKIKGKLDRNSFENAFANVCANYEILRTALRFEQNYAKSLQFITEKMPRIEYQDVSESNSAEIERFCEEIKSSPFDLENADTSRFCLLKESDDIYLLVLTISAFCADAPSVEILIKEIFDSYEESRRQSDEETLQYADLSRWQTELLEEENEAASFWRNFSNEKSLEYDLPTAKRNISEQKLQFENYLIPFETSFLSKITDFLTAQKISSEIFWLSCWTILLSRLSGSENFLLGIKSAGREFEDLRSAVGNLTKFLPFVCPINFEDSFSEILPQIQENLREGRDRHEFFCTDKFTAEIPNCGFDFSENRKKNRASRNRNRN